MTLTFKARVKGGRLVMDEPIDLPENTEVALVLADQGDDLDDEDRARLHAALERSAEQFRQGRTIPAEDAPDRIASGDIDDKKRDDAIEELAAEAQKHRLGY
jgi:hypothetical protein